MSIGPNFQGVPPKGHDEVEKISNAIINSILYFEVWSLDTIYQEISISSIVIMLMVNKISEKYKRVMKSQHFLIHLNEFGCVLNLD